MTLAPSPQAQTHQQDPDWLMKLGGWLFSWRTALPLPIALALLLIPASSRFAAWLWAGVAITALGELIRLWAVRQIGVISRTRSDRLGPLVSSGPFAIVRNPLYLGNIALWAGFSLSAGLPWMAPAIVLLLAFIYHAIVRWEEGLLEARLGDGYRRYAATVPRWIPSGISVAQRQGPGASFSWRDTFFSERGTLIAIAIGYLLLWAKHNG
jgi:protein-S-isoprenylcysteine O-methyltransferase Ste14